MPATTVQLRLSRAVLRKITESAESSAYSARCQPRCAWRVGTGRMAPVKSVETCV